MTIYRVYLSSDMASGTLEQRLWEVPRQLLFQLMRHHRPRSTIASRCDAYKICACIPWRALKLLAAALTIVDPTSSVCGHLQHGSSRGRTWSEVTNNTFIASAFVAYARPLAASWVSFRRQKNLIYAWVDFCCTVPACGGGNHAATSSGSRGCWADGGFERGRSSSSSGWCYRQPHLRGRLETDTRKKTSLEPVYAVSFGSNASSASFVGTRRQPVEGKEATAILTAAGGRPHTTASKAKISAANRGKEPWNKGGSHSEETRRKIAEAARKNALKRKEATARSLGMTLDEYTEMRQRRGSSSERPPEVSDETRLKISTRLKERWKDPLYRERRKSCMPNRQGVPHSETTKARIAAALKERWKDPAYREKIASRIPSEETRAKIGQIIRDQWADPEIRKERMAKMIPKSEEHKKRISESVKSKWADPEFRRKTLGKMREAARARVVAPEKVPRPLPRTPDSDSTVRETRKTTALARSQANNRVKWERRTRTAELKMAKEAKKQEKLALAAARQAHKEAKEEAARRAQQEEDELVEGLDELEMVLMRQQLRAKKLARVENEARAAKRAKDDADTRQAAEASSPSVTVVANVPDGFEMVEVNGRKILRMK